VSRLVVIVAALVAAAPFPPQPRVAIRVDATRALGLMTPMWAWFGHDEPNDTYMKDGRKLPTELAALSPAPVRAISNGFEIAASYPEVRNVPVVIGESDPEGCAACPARVYPANTYRNGTMYSSYTAEQIARTYELAARHRVNLLGSVTWAFEFEDQPYFDGFRDLSTNGIAKPVLNVFRMLGKMRGDRVWVESSGAVPLDSILARGRAGSDISALASRDARGITVLVWNYHDDDLPAAAADVDLAVDGVGDAHPTLRHYRVDRDHSNAYEIWKALGSPQQPTADRRARLETSGQLQVLDPPKQVSAENGQVKLTFTLPRQAVSLVTVTW